MSTSPKSVKEKKKKPLRNQGGGVVQSKGKRGPNRKGPQNQTPFQKKYDQKIGGPANLNAVQATAVPLAENVQQAVVVEQIVTANMLYGFVASYLTRAAQRGYLVDTDSPSNLWYAGVYMYNILTAYFNNAIPQANALPYWLQCVGQSLNQKAISFQGKGEVSYKLRLEPANLSFPSSFIVSQPSYGAMWNAFVPGGTMINLFPVGIPPSSLPADGGQAAWSSLAQFCTNDLNKGTMVVPLKDTYYKRCASSFAVAAQVQGGGFGGVGGSFFTAQLEVPITHPMLSVWVKPDTPLGEATVRAPLRTTVSAGDVFWSSLMGSTVAPNNWGFKKQPRFHFIDFLEFADVLAQWIGAAQTSFFSNPQALDSVKNGGLNPNQFVCPLSLLEVQLLLRNEILAIMNTQIGVQSIYPIAVSSDTQNQFIPYVMSSTTTPQQQVGMLLPLPFVENIRLLKGRVVPGEKNKKNIQKDPIMFVPVWGQYYLDSLVQDNYTFKYTISEETTVLNSFGPGGQVPIAKKKMTRKNTKGQMEEVWVDLLETNISLIDGTSGGNFVFINNQQRLQQLTTLWNTWVQSQQLSTYVDKLVQLGDDSGPSILPFIGSTRYWVLPSGQSTIRHAQVKDHRMQSKNIINTVYSLRNVVGTSYREHPLKPALNFFNMMILPIQFVQAGLTDSVATQQRFSLENGESYFQSSSANGDDGITLASMHASYANKMVHAQLSQTTDWVEFFCQSERDGHGGVLSSLLAQLAGNAFGPAIGNVANGIASVLPF